MKEVGKFLGLPDVRFLWVDENGATDENGVVHVLNDKQIDALVDPGYLARVAARDPMTGRLDVLFWQSDVPVLRSEWEALDAMSVIEAAPFRVSGGLE